ncbi:hypothetical protein D3218_13135 [Aureimonas flava]|uniref:Baseplate protein J-like domain-containing protein n=1 Tax=Aureimonas flava TaxID=2320271 RepID=A0A3A1WI10_9HYPH|nr:hypothetical protein [Aureimonas flava]RIY00223.1 hypothetical protein D3218_13135 [Aureimonas flava]
MNFGVQPTGFVRKNTAQILDEVEQQLVTEFGPGVIQTPQSPLGQINGLFADLVSELWELGEDIYQSYDPDQAEGTRLDILGRLRLVARPGGLPDARFRSAITNEGTARITLADLVTAVRAVDGVTWGVAFVNETGAQDDNGMPPNSIAVAALGGTDERIADAINRFIPPGISSYGNVRVPVEEDGYCRTIKMIRPVETDVELVVRVIRGQTRKGCPSPAPMAIGQLLYDHLTASETRPWNGENITPYTIRSFLEANFDGVIYDSFQARKAEFDEAFDNVVPIDFFEIANVTSIGIQVISE